MDPMDLVDPVDLADLAQTDSVTMSVIAESQSMTSRAGLPRSSRR